MMLTGQHVTASTGKEGWRGRTEPGSPLMEMPWAGRAGEKR